jgi:hypothetical protein
VITVGEALTAGAAAAVTSRSDLEAARVRLQGGDQGTAPIELAAHPLDPDRRVGRGDAEGGRRRRMANSSKSGPAGNPVDRHITF